MFHVSMGGLLFRWGGAPWGALVLVGGGGGSKKIVRWGVVSPHALPLWETLSGEGVGLAMTETNKFFYNSQVFH